MAQNTRMVALSRVPRELSFGQRLGAEDEAAALALINGRYALSPLGPEEVELRRMALAHDAVDRTGERFGREFLERLAASLPGKPVLAHHDKQSWPLGRFYAAELALDAGTGVTWLVARWYLLPTEENAPLRRQIDGGVVSHVSIGFRGGELICDVCGQPFWGDCPHWPGQEITRDGATLPCTFAWTDPRGTAEAVEGSLVWLGAQQGAQIVKEAPDGAGVGCRVLGVGERRAAALTQSGSPSPLPNTQHPTPHTREERSDDLAADGRLYREDLGAEIRRLGGLLGAAMEAEVLCRALADAGAERLKRARDEYQRRVDTQFPPTGAGLPAPAAERPSRPAPINARAHTLV